MKHINISIFSLTTYFLAVALPAASFAQGPLTPPAAPAPSMKTLQQIEPRIDLATIAGNANFHHVITESGSYFLSSNLNLTKAGGIQVIAANVRIDLNGFRVRWTGGSAAGTGIEIGPGAAGCVIENGSFNNLAIGLTCIESFTVASGGAFRNLAVSECASGMIAGESWLIENCTAFDNGGNGITGGKGSTFRGCTARNQAGAGIVAGQGSALSNCTAIKNGGSGGILAGSDCTLLNCAAFENIGPVGIAAYAGSTLTNCIANRNTSSAAWSAGIHVTGAGTIIGCTALLNTNTSENSSGSAGIGISAETGTLIERCTVQSNKGDGIRVGSSCFVRGNTCTSNGNGNVGAGIYVTSGDNRIEGNQLTGNDRGLKVEATTSLILHNSARGNSAGNYEIVAGNRVGAIVVPPLSGAVNGNSGAAGFGSNDPWANFAY